MHSPYGLSGGPLSEMVERGCSEQRISKVSNQDCIDSYPLYGCKMAWKLRTESFVYAISQ